MELSNYPKVTAIMRNYTYEEAMEIIRILADYAGKVGVEVTTNTPDYLKIIKDGTGKFGDKVYIGAGTVLDYRQATDVIAAGAKFMLSPQAFSPEIFALAKEKGVITVPAAMSPSEVSAMFAAGADIVKIFPAITVGPNFFKQMAGPFGKQRLMAVGGVSLKNIPDFVANGVEYFGIGSSMFNKEDVKTKNVTGIKTSIENYLQLVGEGMKND